MKAVYIQNMHSVYANAEVTIVAADGANAHAGLAGISRPRRIAQIWYDSTDIDVVLQLKEVVHSIEGSPWKSRAWTYQEGLLSKRLLVFTQDLSYLVCPSMLWREDMSTRSLIHRKRHSGHMFLDKDYKMLGGSLGLFDTYFKILQGYIGRQLTDPGDILDAFSGIIQAFSQWNPGATFRCGLPVDHFPVALRWYVETIWKDSHREISSRRVDKYPSWTWAGWSFGECAMFYSPFLSISEDHGSTASVFGVSDEMQLHRIWEPTRKTSSFEEFILGAADYIPCVNDADPTLRKVKGFVARAREQQSLELGNVIILWTRTLTIPVQRSQLRNGFFRPQLPDHPSLMFGWTEFHAITTDPDPHSMTFAIIGADTRDNPAQEAGKERSVSSPSSCALQLLALEGAIQDGLCTRQGSTKISMSLRGVEPAGSEAIMEWCLARFSSRQFIALA
jgi:hypothetical protein